jgi:hypothetical protein
MAIYDFHGHAGLFTRTLFALVSIYAIQVARNRSPGRILCNRKPSRYLTRAHVSKPMPDRAGGGRAAKNIFSPKII